MNDTIALLRARRSAPPAVMSGPGPTPQEIEILLALAARVPDHGKLAPWRFILFEGAGRERAGEIFAEIYAKAHPGEDDQRVAAERNRFCLAPLVVGVISRAAPHQKIPEWEQVLSAGAVCMNLMVAANALGYLPRSGSPNGLPMTAPFLRGLASRRHERVAGLSISGGRTVRARIAPGRSLPIS